MARLQRPYGARRRGVVVAATLAAAFVFMLSRRSMLEGSDVVPTMAAVGNKRVYREQQPERARRRSSDASAHSGGGKQRGRSAGRPAATIHTGFFFVVEEKGVNRSVELLEEPLPPECHAHESLDLGERRGRVLGAGCCWPPASSCTSWGAQGMGCCQRHGLSPLTFYCAGL